MQIVDEFSRIFILLEPKLSLARKPSHVFLSYNSDFAWNDGWVELGHMHVQYMDVQSESREEVHYLCLPWINWYNDKQK